jgi:hypothetical protein
MCALFQRIFLFFEQNLVEGRHQRPARCRAPEPRTDTTASVCGAEIMNSAVFRPESALRTPNEAFFSKTAPGGVLKAEIPDRMVVLPVLKDSVLFPYFVRKNSCFGITKSFPKRGVLGDQKNAFSRSPAGPPVPYRPLYKFIFPTIVWRPPGGLGGSKKRIVFFFSADSRSFPVCDHPLGIFSRFISVTVFTGHSRSFIDRRGLGVEKGPF